MTTAALTPPEVARQLRVSADKVRTWISAGELAAIDVATRRGGRPRWRIDPKAIEDFERRRQAIPVTTTRRRKRQEESKTDFVAYY